MRITDLLIAEHRLLRLMLTELDASLKRGTPDDGLRAQAVIVAAAFADHAHIEGDVLAPFMASLGADSAYLSGNMQVIDSVIAVELAKAALPNSDVRALLTHAILLAGPQFDTEEEDVFPEAEAKLGRGNLAALTHAIDAHGRMPSDGMGV
jgi:hypothetical protein